MKICVRTTYAFPTSTPPSPPPPLSLCFAVYTTHYLYVCVYHIPVIATVLLNLRASLCLHTATFSHITYGAPQLEGQPDSFAFTHRNLLTHTSVLATVLLNLRASLIPLPSHRATFSHTPTNQPHTRVRRTERGGVRPARLALMLWSSTT